MRCLDLKKALAENSKIQRIAGLLGVPLTEINFHSGLEQFIKRIEVKPLAVIPTVLLLKSAGMARYIDRNIKGISIPPEIIRDIQKAPDKVKECVRIASEIVVRIREMGMAGVLLSTVGWEDKLPLILDEAKL